MTILYKIAFPKASHYSPLCFILPFFITVADTYCSIANPQSSVLSVLYILIYLICSIIGLLLSVIYKLGNRNTRRLRNESNVMHVIQLVSEGRGPQISKPGSLSRVCALSNCTKLSLSYNLLPLCILYIFVCVCLSIYLLSLPRRMQAF